jgi:hypothetical protein
MCIATRASAQSSCESQLVRVRTPLPSEWASALRDACARVAALPELDAGVVVRIEFRAPALVLEATRADGRSTERAVIDPKELFTTLEALVTLPPGAAPELPAARVSEPHASSSTPERAALPHAAVPSPILVEFGAEMSSRVAWTPTYLSPALGLHIGVRLAGWMLGLDARSEPYQFPVGRVLQGFEMDGFGVGIFLNRRLFDGPVGLDLGVRAMLGVENQALEANEIANQASVVDVRAGTLARLLLGRQSPRWTVALDAELSPMRLRREFKIYQYLPGVSLGLAFGVALESR